MNRSKEHLLRNCTNYIFDLFKLLYDGRVIDRLCNMVISDFITCNISFAHSNSQNSFKARG